jgi:glycosyltransferase involved in cell wall biosynthesis
LYTLYNGVDLCKFSPDDAVEREDGYIVAVGRLVEKKGFAHLIEACCILLERGDKFRCEIVGDGELRGRLERQIRRRRLNNFVKIVGARSQEELPDYYRRAAVLVLPAVCGRDGNQDGLPTVLLEAIACRAPVVASRIEGIPEIVEHEDNGLLVEPANPVELAQAVGRLLINRRLRERFGAAGRVKAEASFDLHTNASVLYRLLSEHATSGTPILAR